MKRKPNWLRLTVHALAWGLLVWLVWSFINDPINPIQATTKRSGYIALVFLVLSLAATPTNTLFGFRQAITVRRTLGLFAFMFAGVHFLIFSVLDYGLDWSLLRGAIFEKPFVLVGLTALTILLTLAVTSFKWWMKRLGKNWKRLHRLVYLAAPLVVVHYSWSVKGDVLRLQGDILQPLAFGLAVALLLIARLPPVRRTATHLRSRLTQRLSGPVAESPQPVEGPNR
ncbi:MAG: putative rane protein [Chloroflexi bacterium]|jgi:sulfoxide reductase heme-binding subunit YedZ|nr:putative rane protein [Chloroflexota bacterium]